MKKGQYSVSCGCVWWPVDGLHQQPCSHQLNARVGHCRRFFRHFGFVTMDEAKTNGRISFNGDETSPRRIYMMDKNSIVKQTSILMSGWGLTAGKGVVRTGIYMADHVEERKRRRTMWRPGSSPAWRRHQPFFNLSNSDGDMTWGFVRLFKGPWE